MSSLLAKVMERGIFRVPARRKRKIEVKPGSRRPSHRSLCGPSRSAGDALKGRGLGVYR